MLAAGDLGLDLLSAGMSLLTGDRPLPDSGVGGALLLTSALVRRFKLLTGVFDEIASSDTLSTDLLTADGGGVGGGFDGSVAADLAMIRFGGNGILLRRFSRRLFSLSISL
jgi:hypothetical protein